MKKNDDTRIESDRYESPDEMSSFEKTMKFLFFLVKMKDWCATKILKLKEIMERVGLRR